MKTKLRDEIEALTSAFDHIQYIEKIIEDNALDLALKSNLLAQLCCLRERLADDCLYMAVVGEASTGKSTFINALLGTSLLEARVLTMTTSLPTKIKYGEQLSVEICFYRSEEKSEENIKVQRLTQQDEPISISELPGIERLSLSELIGELTTRNDLASRIADLTIYFPSAFLSDGICIIDTPGADATDAEHAVVTRQAVAAADAAIIITPARQIVSDTLLKLIKNHLQLIPFLHRSIFLITEMDLIRKEERMDVLAGACQRLARGLKEVGDLPPVLCASAQSVMDEVSRDNVFIVRKESDRLYWQQQFKLLKAELLSRMQQQRAVTIAESLLRLLDDVLSALDSHLSEKWAQGSAKQAALEAAIIPDLDSFTSQQHKDCYNTMTTAATEARVWSENAVEAESSRTLKEVENGVASAGSLKELKSYLEQNLSIIINRNQQNLQTQLSPYFDNLQQTAQDISQVFDQRFEEAYQRLSATQHTLSAGDATVKLSLAASDLIASGNSSGAFTTASMGQRATGAAVAMVVGAILLPGLGLLIPAVLGSIFSGFLGPSLEERKRTLLAEIRPKLIAQFSDAKINVVRAVCQYDQELRDAVDQHIDNHEARYAKTVKVMRAVQQQQASQLKAEQAVLDRNIQAIAQRRDRVNLQQRKIGLMLLKVPAGQVSSA
jgi:hypothetical protein